MNTIDPNSPEGQLVAVRAQLATVAAERDALKASAAPGALESLKKELADTKKSLVSTNVALAKANAQLAERGGAPVLTFTEQVKARSAEIRAKAEADALAAKLAVFDAKRYLSAEDKAELLGMMATLPEAEKRNFWLAHLRGK